MGVGAVQHPRRGAVGGHQVEAGRGQVRARLRQQPVQQRLDRRAPAEVDQHDPVLARRSQAARRSASAARAGRSSRTRSGPAAPCRPRSSPPAGAPGSGSPRRAPGRPSNPATSRARCPACGSTRPTVGMRRRWNSASSSSAVPSTIEARAHTCRDSQIGSAATGDSAPGAAALMRSLSSRPSRIMQKTLLTPGLGGAVVDPLGEPRHRRAQRGGAEAPERPQLRGLAGALGAVQHLRAQRGQAVVAVVGAQRGAGVHVLGRRSGGPARRGGARSTRP